MFRAKILLLFLATLALTAQSGAQSCQLVVETRTVCSSRTTRTPTTKPGELKTTTSVPAAGPSPSPPSPNPPSNGFYAYGAPQTPVNLVVTSDDRYATLSYDTNPTKYYNPGMGAACQAYDWQTRLSAYRHSGYIVTWGPVGGTISKAFTPYQWHQMQPLTPGVSYTVSVQAVANDGTVTPPSVSLTFASNSTRVDALRTSMAGFFDDFNIAPGPLDETKWNAAVSQCSYPQYSAAFINAQFHAHQVVGAPIMCEKGLLVLRPRNTFDFTGRTGTVVFDFDGSFSKTNWYLDLMNGDMVDTEGQIHIADMATPGSPSNMLRIRSSFNGEQTLAVLYFGPDGIFKVVKTVALDKLGIPLIRNVRRPFVVKISQTTISITVSGKLVLTAALSLPYSTGTLHFTIYSYDTTVADENFALIHWDNFGFDGPPASVLTRNYPTYSPRLYYDQYSLTSWGTKGAWQNHFPVSQYTPPLSFRLFIPDSLTGIVAARFMFTMHAEINTPTIVTPNDIVKINGVSIGPIPPPVEGNLSTQAISSFEAGRAFIMQLNPQQLVTWLASGKNLTITFVVPSGSPSRFRVGNLHIEVDYPTGSNPSYTPPTPWYGALTAAGNYHPVYQTLQEKIGPAYQVIGLFPAYTYKYADMGLALGSKAAGVPIPYNAVVQLSVIVQNEIEITGYGTGSPLTYANLLSNNKSIPGVAALVLPGTQSVALITFSFNTASLGPQGATYELMPLLNNTKGAPALPNFHLQIDNKLGSRTGDYLPFKIRTM